VEKLSLSSEIAPFVKEIIFFESTEAIHHNIPFYADGFSGIVFSKSEEPFTILPQSKVLPNFYLFGQTIIPMSLKTKGTFQVYAVRLFPFAVRTLIGVDPKSLNDDCYDLLNVKGVDTSNTIVALQEAKEKSEIVTMLSKYVNELIKNAAENIDHRVVLATNMILKSDGNIRINDLLDRLYITERTLERQFKKEIGVTAIQFTKIIQFHSSKRMISEDDYINLTDISFKSGYADQSHFIRNFKRFTGKTPKEFQSSLSA
jgi:AraC-like DNA-binding protein